MNTTTRRNILAVIVFCCLAVGFFMTAGPRSTVAWNSVRAVVFQSDDWGLAGFVPNADAWRSLDRDQLETGYVPEAYWLSTLEDSTMVARLSAVLAAHTGRDGHPAVLQPNYVMSSLSPHDDQWDRYDLPDLPPGYRRAGLWKAVRDALARGTWYPELHATWHYDPQIRKRNAFSTALSRQATERGILVFPGSERAWELGAWRSLADLTSELDHSLAVFRKLFGRDVNSVMAPDYHWDDRIEAMWGSRNLNLIQGKREQINPAWGNGMTGRVMKYVMRQRIRLVFPNRIYLERNCRLEPSQVPDTDVALQSCVTQTADAWAAGQPAIIESHRINFAHTDAGMIAVGLDVLDRYLGEISKNRSEVPLFLTDHELGQLYARGTSWCVRGGVVVVRNETHGRKVVPIPPAAQILAAAQGGRGMLATPKVIFVGVPAGSTIDFIP